MVKCRLGFPLLHIVPTDWEVLKTGMSQLPLPGFLAVKPVCAIVIDSTFDFHGIAFLPFQHEVDAPFDSLRILEWDLRLQIT